MSDTAPPLERERDGLRCPKCESTDVKVRRTRYRRSTRDVKRRHRCEGCGHRFSSVQAIVVDAPAEISS